ncbi:GvpL/GvpF family gas vesicle protein [Streptomyces marincola]|uniref:GvpL/GvpF family gas vesicle protein n=1 Tax=Streptomyces marincola TaxID=2878388 RepID=UPI001CF4B093|nr:GvpL/GvpF family gas vesicle protein [Streptomyces marincola]UCM87007.1 GvpL/GvpF family gas vesicle protein [Streptomyces marincola]
MSTYVYGIARAGSPRLLPDGLTGVGDPPRPVRALRAGGLVAIASDCPPGLRPKRRDLFAHQRVLTVVSAGGAVLPLRFGSVSADDAAVRAALTEHAALHHQQLDSVADRVEYNVKAAHHEDVILRRVVAESPEIRRLNEATRSGGAAYQDRLRLGELVADAVREREESDARAVEEALRPHAGDSRPGPDGTGRVVNVSYLVGRDEAAGFLAAVDRLREESPQLDLRVSGPLPPYSFVRMEPAEAA